ncbi:MAG TPA: isopentenyl-diphosphate Delta-isomerase [Gammaproteobacteria bacterium]|nr:isopentenyl-diphosphate Delta-isomerase [Gammaproteobacteria bacterium]
MTATEHIALVDEEDNFLGTAEKLFVHEQGLCHRAFSVFIFRQGLTTELLLQQRARGKYHSPLLWTNTCCSHPRPDEDIVAAGERRLLEEMGMTTPLEWVGKFHYIAHFENGLIENEVDHVLVGFLTDPVFKVNPEEVAATRWITLPDLKDEMTRTPDQFTPWLKQALAQLEMHYLAAPLTSSRGLSAGSS